MNVAPYRQVARITGPMPALPFGLKPAGGPGLRLAALAPVATSASWWALPLEIVGQAQR